MAHDMHAMRNCQRDREFLLDQQDRDPALRIRSVASVLATAEIVKNTLAEFHRDEDYGVTVPLELLEQAKTTRLMFMIFMGIIAASGHLRPSIRGGVEYLANTQNADGSWTEDHITGTGFPKVFYLKYDMYRNSWPLLALATYRKILLASQKAKTNGHTNGNSHHLAEALKAE